MIAEQGSCFLNSTPGVSAVRQTADRLVHGVDEASLPRRTHREPELASRRHGHAVQHRRRFGPLVLAVEDLGLPTTYWTMPYPNIACKRPRPFACSFGFPALNELMLLYSSLSR